MKKGEKYHGRRNRRGIGEETIRIARIYEEKERPLKGLTFVFTGELEQWTRDEAKRLVEKLGGRSTSSVSGETDYVVAGPGAGSKLEEAKKHDIPIMDEEEFVEFIGYKNN